VSDRHAVGGRAEAAATLFLCGDVMLGRGIDQILPKPCAPELRESFIKSALDYVALAERAHGPVPRGVAYDYIWGAALEELERVRPVARLANLETSVTCSSDFAAKGINYRVSPENAACLAVAKFDCCALANNHVLDFGMQGLADTLATLRQLKIAPVGAGRDAEEAAAPATLDLGGNRLIVLACGAQTSGIPSSWSAQARRPGVYLTGLSDRAADEIIAKVASVRGPGDLGVVSIHWGANWGHEIPAEERRFAHRLIDGGIDVVHGHSSHHAKAIEIYRGRLILYGCGDFINDYEGIAGYEQFRDDLALMYFPTIGRDGLTALDLAVLQIRRFRLIHASQEDCARMQYRLDHESRRFGTRVDFAPDGRLSCRPVLESPRRE
jgi:poly-gamma-glutamate synthesis protein (capsule biosynthesis protein)